MNKAIILSLLLLFSFACFSQFNDSINYHLAFSSSGIVNKTNNNDSYILNNALIFNTKKKNITINVATNWIYGVQQHHLTNNDFGAHSDVDVYKGIHKLYYWGLVNYDKSYSLKINHRLQAGGGLAYNIIDSPGIRINISDGILYEEGDIIDAVRGRDIYQVPRNSFRLLYHLSLKEKLVIDGIHFYQPSLTGIKDYIIQSSNNISLKLNRWLSITGVLTYNKVNRTKRENLLITYGLAIEKYF